MGEDICLAGPYTLLNFSEADGASGSASDLLVTRFIAGEETEALKRQSDL